MRISDWSSDVCSSDLPVSPKATQAAAISAGMTKGSAVQPGVSRAAATSSPPSAAPWVRSGERRVGKECVSRSGSRGEQTVKKKKEVIHDIHTTVKIDKNRHKS